MLLARAWSDVLAVLPRAMATNLLSVVCTAAAGGTLAWLLARSSGKPLPAFGAALCAGGTSAVWLNATETEVYAPALLLAVLTLVVAVRASESAEGDSRWIAVVAYAIALAVPLHASALVAAPAAIVAATFAKDGSVRWFTGAVLSGAFVIAAGVSTGSFTTAVAGFAILCMTTAWRRNRRAVPLILCVTFIALTALSYLLIRAVHDPAINSGDPHTLGAVWELVARRQYAVAPLWPRQAPLWLQFANLLEYADWQFALGLAPGVAPTWTRTPVTAWFLLLGVLGARWHRRADRRAWLVLLTLLSCATIGLVVQLNFKAGASIGFGVLPANAPHEPRERDYFFALAFWTWGAWAGWGAIALGVRLLGAWGAAAGTVVAALPLGLNWAAMDRRGGPEVGVALAVAEALLASAPPRAVLLTGGDNDSFPLWYAQVVGGLRSDVTVVAIPLLGARWYRAQLARRDSLLAPAPAGEEMPWRGERATLAEIGQSAAARRRPFVSAITANPRAVHAIGAPIVLRGFVFVRDTSSAGVWSPLVGAHVDTAAAPLVIRFANRFRAERFGEAIDPAPRWISARMQCAVTAILSARTTDRATPVDSLCSRR